MLVDSWRFGILLIEKNIFVIFFLLIGWLGYFYYYFLFKVMQMLGSMQWLKAVRYLPVQKQGIKYPDHPELASNHLFITPICPGPISDCLVFLNNHLITRYEVRWNKSKFCMHTCFLNTELNICWLKIPFCQA